MEMDRGRLEQERRHVAATAPATVFLVTMLDSFHLGGWGMYPTLAAGLALVIASIAQVVRPDRGRALLRQLTWLVALFALLGFLTGVIKCFVACGDAPGYQVAQLALAGMGESLTNLALGLAMLAVARIVHTFGAARGDTGTELADPHAG
jgi:hypothetical protein